MDNTSGTQRVRKRSQVSDDDVEGCCLIFTRPQRKNVRRRPLFRLRVKRRNSQKALSNKSTEGHAAKVVEHTGIPTHGDMEFLRTTRPANTVDVETEDAQSTFKRAIISLNDTITRFYDTLGEFAES